MGEMVDCMFVSAWRFYHDLIIDVCRFGVILFCRESSGPEYCVKHEFRLGTLELYTSGPTTDTPKHQLVSMNVFVTVSCHRLKPAVSTPKCQKQFKSPRKCEILLLTQI